ncbi:FRIGIDA-like protein 5 isoform X3 [Prunus dulcis]|uniref:FRIGIDA-like protein 5 isoform X3 n=1 Tax=Prunus dulcis TaxID=3755 RepID=UPI0014832A11|nr:FRIGIDA-like protein 5 isoform X3 [Prunus dulcis]
MSETKQSCLGQAYEALHAQASSILHFGVQWKELEDHFESTRNSLQTRLRELENREKKIDDREKRLGALELNFDSEMASKAEKLRGVEKSIEEVESGKHHFNLQSLKLLIEEHNEELDVKEKRFSELQRLVGEKERECDLIDKRVKERTKKLNWVMKCVEERSKEVESKKEEVEVVQGVLNKCREDIELQERQLNWMMGMIEERQKVYNLREEQINAAQISIEECDDKMKLKMEELRLVQRSLEECSNTLESKENIIREMELKLRDFYLLKKSMEEWSSELEFKERELEGWFEKLELKEKQFEPQLEELHLMDKRINECLNEVQLQEKHLDSLQKSIQEREKNLDSLSYGLKLKERQLEQLAKELELKQKEVDWIRKSTETNTKKRRLKTKTNILDSQAKIEQLEHTPGNNATVPFSKSIQSRIYRNGRDLQLFLNEHLKRHDLLGTEISAILQASSDPAKLVLDAMQGFYPSNSVVENWECDFDLSVIRRSCILLLQELKRVSPQINPQVRGEAKKLAGNWKDKMIAVVENWLEVLGFLLLLTTYDLTSTYDENELQSLLVVVSQHSLATELRQALGISDKANDFIQNLIERKQLFEAFRFICTFKVNDKFSSVPLLKEYVEGARKSYRTTWRKKKSLDEKKEVVDHQIADLRAVIQCIKDYRLDSEYPSKDIEIQIVQLEKMKENWIKMAKSLGSKAEQEEKSLGFKAEQEEKSLGSKDGQRERSLAATQVEQEDKPLASKEKNKRINLLPPRRRNLVPAILSPRLNKRINLLLPSRRNVVL